VSTLTTASPATLDRMAQVARQRAREANRRYSDHVLRFCRDACARGGVCPTARALDREASAADWAVARLKRS
jgi:hypothetical protein